DDGADQIAGAIPPGGDAAAGEQVGHPLTYAWVDRNQGEDHRGEHRRRDGAFADAESCSHRRTRFTPRLVLQGAGLPYRNRHAALQGAAFPPKTARSVRTRIRTRPESHENRVGGYETGESRPARGPRTPPRSARRRSPQMPLTRVNSR